MRYQLTIQGQKVAVTIVRSHRTKRVSLRIVGPLAIRVTAPRLIPELFITTFVQSKVDWIKAHLPTAVQSPTVKHDESLLRVKARNLIRTRLDHYNQIYGYRFKRITIRDQKTRWGSCSSSGTLSFNYKLALLPLELVDYVVVHELCHLKQMNHSRAFWDLVAKTLPHYPMLIRQLRKHEKTLM